MTTRKYFKDPFALAGDKTAVPDDIQPGGSVSYTEGWGFKYALDTASDPTALDIDRSQTNQMFFDVTNALQQYQVFGIPLFITTAENGGTPYSYNKYAMCVYDDGVNGERIYQSKVNTNTALPSDTTKWRWVDNSAGVLLYDNAAFEGTVVDNNVVYWDEAHTWFAKALADGTEAQQVIGIADVTNSLVYMLGLKSGLTGLTAGRSYYLSSSTAGTLTTTAPDDSDVIQVGFSKSTTELFINPEIKSTNKFCFNATTNVNQLIPVSALLTKVNFPLAPNNPSGNFNTTTSEFTATEKGFYFFNTQITFDITPTPLPIGTRSILGIAVNGAYLNNNAQAVQLSPSTFYIQCAAQVYLTAGDVVTVGVEHNDTSPHNIENNPPLVYFNGFKTS